MKERMVRGLFVCLKMKMGNLFCVSFGRVLMIFRFSREILEKMPVKMAERGICFSDQPYFLVYGIAYVTVPQNLSDVYRLSFTL